MKVGWLELSSKTDNNREAIFWYLIILPSETISSLDDSLLKRFFHHVH